MNRRFQIVIASPGNYTSNALTRLGRLKKLLGGLAVITAALAVLIAALILGYIIAVFLAVVFILVIAILFVKSFFRRLRADRSLLTRD